MPSKAIVTLVIGDAFQRLWKRFCEANWRAYAERYGYDIVCIERPLDESDRARRRHVSWQKCLILSQPFAKRYDRIVWVDADVLINLHRAPCATDGVPEDRIGVLDMFGIPNVESYRECLRRMFELWGAHAVVNDDPQSYYRNYGFPQQFDRAARNGMMVLTPRFHRELLERSYYEYEDRGPAWNAEMRPFSYELLRAGCEHWLDPQFDVNWYEVCVLQYPFLVADLRRDLLSRAARVSRRLLGLDCDQRVRKACVNAAFWNSFTLHFGSGTRQDMALVDLHATSWRSCRL